MTSIFIVINVLFWLFVIIVELYETPRLLVKRLFASLKVWKKREVDENPSVEKRSILFEEALRSIGVSFDMLKTSQGRAYTFHYQNGNFVVRIEEGIGAYRFLFLGILSLQVDLIDDVRILCNELNDGSPFVRAIYEIVDEGKSICIHLTETLPYVSNLDEFKHQLLETMNACFYVRDYAGKRMNKILEDVRRANTVDVEFASACNTNCEHLCRELELKHTKDTLPELDNSEGLSAGEIDPATLLTHLIGEIPYTFVKMEVRVDGYAYETSDIADVANYPLSTPLLWKQDEASLADEFQRQEAQIKIECKLAKDCPAGSEARIYTFYFLLHAEYQTTDALYYRVTYVLPAVVTPHEAAASAIDAEAKRNAGSLLLARDLVSDSAKHAEFSYMLSDVNDKVTEGKENELTPEQTMLRGLENNEFSQNAYWGRRLFREERFFEATVRLQRAHQWATLHFQELSKVERNIFYYICYLLGVCFEKMQLYKEAHYYLYALGDQRNPDYVKEYINTLIALHDIHVRDIINGYLQPIRSNLEEYDEEEAEMPQAVLDLYQFLRRREVYVDIEQGYLDEAERLCKKMLDEKENSDFALTELAYIQKLREAGQTSRELPKSASEKSS